MGLGPHPGNGVDVTSTAHGVTRKAASTRFGASLRSRGAICSPGLYQANQIELIRHCHQLAMDGLVSERFAIEHGAKHELGPRFSTKHFQFMVTSILTACLTPGDKSTETLVNVISGTLSAPAEEITMPYRIAELMCIRSPSHP